MLMSLFIFYTHKGDNSITVNLSTLSLSSFAIYVRNAALLAFGICIQLSEQFLMNTNERAVIRRRTAAADDVRLG